MNEQQAVMQFGVVTAPVHTETDEQYPSPYAVGDDVHVSFGHMTEVLTVLSATWCPNKWNHGWTYKLLCGTRGGYTGHHENDLRELEARYMQESEG